MCAASGRQDGEERLPPARPPRSQAQLAQSSNNAHNLSRGTDSWPHTHAQTAAVAFGHGFPNLGHAMGLAGVRTVERVARVAANWGSW